MQSGDDFGRNSRSASSLWRGCLLTVLDGCQDAKTAEILDTESKSFKKTKPKENYFYFCRKLFKL